MRAVPDEDPSAAETQVRWLDAHQQRDWRAFILGTTLLFDRLDDDLHRKHGLSLTEYEILVRLSERDGHRMRMAQLADAVAHSRSRVTHTVKRLEDAGYVHREKAPDDGRGIVCTLTDRGMLLLENTAPTHVRGVREHLVDLVSAEDFAALGRAMNAVSDHLVAAHPEMEIRDDRGPVPDTRRRGSRED
ncbi:MarR family winged helix-turn-helix transcriptional regulator [Nocardioides coralli]|uniref:MarR family winged helix-turn-helix transcriptional regulator n=1 Tax=Nocardioides coralli TaxID=2872154 RepID=UPI001CA38E1C|nr:MarR family transcriptional regulator [Nocardioides coralli]QZY28310.1 MarR family transcriptional regulator [Nocardioides coralli]